MGKASGIRDRKLRHRLPDDGIIIFFCSTMGLYWFIRNVRYILWSRNYLLSHRSDTIIPVGAFSSNSIIPMEIYFNKFVESTMMLYKFVWFQPCL